MKTFVLTFSKEFMNGHPKQGEPTHFEQKIISGQKIHTIRSNFEYWHEKVREVKLGKARLSLREWKGKPYRSKQREFWEVLPRYNPFFQRVKITPTGSIYVDGERASSGEVIKNDGLTVEEFDAWFGDELFEGIIIHFTDFRY